MKKIYIVTSIFLSLVLVLGTSIFWSETRTIGILEPMNPLTLSASTAQEPTDIYPGEETCWIVDVTNAGSQPQTLSATINIVPPIRLWDIISWVLF